MSKNRKVILLSIVVFILLWATCSIVTALKFIDFQNQVVSNRKTQIATEYQLLQEISKKTGLEPTWLTFRENIYCRVLHKGMTRVELEDYLSSFGKIKTYGLDNEIYFDNRTIDAHLGPIIVYFDNPGPDGRLIKWRRSYEENLGFPHARCEDNH